AGFGSVPTERLEPAVLLIVPLALPPTLTTSVRFGEGEPEARLAIVQVSVWPVRPTVKLLQDQPPFVSRKNVVCAGTTSVSVTVPALLGPLLVTPIVYVSSVPGVTLALGDALFEVTRSAETGPTVVATVWALFPSAPAGSAVVEDAVAVLLAVAVVLRLSLTTSVRLDDGAPEARLGMVHVSRPVRAMVGVV